MALDRMQQILTAKLAELTAEGAAKEPELVIDAILPAAGEFGPSFRLAGEGSAGYLRMNSNGYLGLAQASEVIAAEEKAVRSFGAGPGAVRFIGSTWAPHVALVARLANFHSRPAAMVFSSAYAAVMGVLLPLITAETAVISDDLNHNSIINAVPLQLGLETIPGAHPVVPLMVRDTQRTATLVKHLRDNHILATGLNYPMVPKDDEEIRFQICADHTPADINHALAVLAAFEG